MSATDPTPAEPKCEGLAPFVCGNPGCPVHGEPAVPDTGDVNALAVALCDADESWEHHDATDDHPCLRCKALAVRMLPYVAEVRRETAEQVLTEVEHHVEDDAFPSPPHVPLRSDNGYLSVTTLRYRLAEIRDRIAREGGAR